MEYQLACCFLFGYSAAAMFRALLLDCFALCHWIASQKTLAMTACKNSAEWSPCWI